MEIRISARHFELSDNLKDFSEEEINRLQKYYSNIINAELTMSVEKSRQIAELSVKVYGTLLTSKAKAFDMYLAVEQVVTKMERQIKKYKGKLKDKKGAKKSPPKTRPVPTDEEDFE